MNGSLNSILSNAASGMRAAQAGVSVVSDDIANADVAGYTAKTQETAAFVVGDQTSGVRTGQVTRSVDEALQAGVWSQASRVGALTVRSGVLTSINAAQGTPGDGTSLADAVTALQNSFTQLQAQPSSQTQQAAVVSAADGLASTIRNVAASISTQRNNAQLQIETSVEALNSALVEVNATTHEIVAAKQAGNDTATLEDQRDKALQAISGLLDVHYDKQADGNIAILGRNGFSIPLDGTFSTTAATLSPAAVGAGSVPPILLQSTNPSEPAVDVTSHLSGGSLGELVQLRDATLPSYAANLDGFSAKLANRFSAQGLRLFGDGTSEATLAATPGLSSVIAVNPAVAATPSMVRDGTAGTSYPVNPADGPAGYAALIDRVLGNTFAAGGGTTSLAADAGAFVSKQSADTAQASADLKAATSYQTTLSTRFSDGSSVNVDQEMGLMIQLQNSYQANARVVQAAQRMFTDLLNATNAA